MKARPILFSAPMIRALLDGTKTQTRRIVKGEALRRLDDGFTPAFVVDPGNAALCPYGVAGDLLWARETWASDGNGGFRYYATDTVHELRRKRVSIHMPRAANRLTLRMVDVRVERLHDLSEADAQAEGASPCENGWWFDNSPELAGCDARGAYYCLWEKINGPGSWAANPWVWVLDFNGHVYLENIDRVIEAHRVPR